MSTHDPVNDPRFADVVSRLRAQPAPESSADFTDRTMARLRRARASEGLSTFCWRAAAVLAVLLGASFWFVRPHPAPSSMVQEPSPVDVLLAAQRPDGGWSVDPGRPAHRYDVGVTSLALLALMSRDPAPLQGPGAEAIRAGINHLARRLGPDGRFADDSSSAGYNPYLAGMALQMASRLPGADPAWAAAATRARSHLPSHFQMAKLNASLAQPDSFPARWADAGGPVARTAIALLQR